MDAETLVLGIVIGMAIPVGMVLLMALLGFLFPEKPEP